MGVSFLAAYGLSFLCQWILLFLKKHDHSKIIESF